MIVCVDPHFGLKVGDILEHIFTTFKRVLVKVYETYWASKDLFYGELAGDTWRGNLETVRRLGEGATSWEEQKEMRKSCEIERVSKL